MKLIFCKSCCDLRRLHLGSMTYCDCGKSFGMYIDEVTVVISSAENCVPLEIDSLSFTEAVRNHDNCNKCEFLNFSSFVIRNGSDKIERIDNP